MSGLARWNPFPLKVLCSIWDQCGNKTNSLAFNDELNFAAPWTTSPSQRDCNSNCSAEIISSDPPLTRYTVGYFEGWNEERPCLNMEASEIPVDAYTHLHFGFAGINRTFDIQVNDSMASQWKQFIRLSGPKLILSFGESPLSIPSETHSLFSQSIGEDKRATFAAKITSFVNHTGIDGVDFAWQYPRVQQGVPGMMSASPNDSSNYLAFLQELRATLPKNKSISIAVPASPWYLKAFPVAELASHVDYINYMTYDFHGQWDYGNPYSDTACPEGNCLRSGVNSTETYNALAMITQLGVPSNKIVVGVTSYGRSFQMTQANCTGPMCTYTGPQSGATPGVCTRTAGFLAQAEIDLILEDYQSAYTYYDNSSESDIMVYNSTQWVSYMSYDTTIARTRTYLDWNFLGTVDWAIDLAAFAGVEAELMEPLGNSSLPSCREADNYNTVQEVKANSSIPSACVNMYLLNALSKTLAVALENYTHIMNNDYDDKYNAFAKAMRSQGLGAWVTLTSPDEADNYFTCKQDNGGYNVTVSCTALPGGSYFYWTYKNETETCHKLKKNYGMKCSWLVWNSYPYSPQGQDSEQCERFALCPPSTSTMYKPNLPEDFPVFNPASAIKKALSNYTRFSAGLRQSALESQLYLLSSSASDVALGSSTLVFSVSQAVKSMQSVAVQGEKDKKEQHKEMIMAYLFGILPVIPVIGEIAASFEALEDIVLMITMADVVAQVGLAYYMTIEDPKNAWMIVLELLLGGLVYKEAGAWARTAELTEEMGAKVAKFLGKEVAEQTDDVKGLVKSCYG